MIKFDIDLLRVDHMRIKSISAALGGMMTVVDDKKSKKLKKEAYTKVSIPHSVARTFIKKHALSKYIKPVLSAVTTYDGRVVAVERHPAGVFGQDINKGLDDKDVAWWSDSEQNLDTVIMPFARRNDWQTDGTFMYVVLKEELRDAEFLCQNGSFRAVKVNAIKFEKIGMKRQDLQPEERTALAFYARNGKMAMTPPIWRTLSEVGNKQLKRGGNEAEKPDEKSEDDSDDQSDSSGVPNYQFDRVDQYLSVNLGFALKAGREVATVFGYDAIEPLGLDDLMLLLKTVNLPNIDNAVKQSFDTGMPFTHAMAWLIGLADRVNSLESYVVLRSLLKYLTTKGVYRKGAFEDNAVFRNGADASMIKLKSVQEAGNVPTMDLETMLLSRRRARANDHDINNGVLGDAH